MIHVLCNRPSSSARTLVAALRQLGYQAQRLRTNAPHYTGLLVCWGNPVEELPAECAALNAFAGIGTKCAEIITLATAGVRVPRYHPRAEPRPQGNWHGRRLRHRSGNDLLHRGPVDFWTEHVETLHEFRVHIFRDLCIRVGIKVPRICAHPWIRTHERGWAIDYGQACQSVITQEVRHEAKNAVAALGYDFGAVDIAVRPDRTPVVFEVNSAPGLETQATALAYARHIGALSVRLGASP